MRRDQAPSFFKIPSIVYNTKEEELTGNKEYIDSFYMVNFWYIVSYMPHGYERDGSYHHGTWIQLATHGIQSPLTIDQFEALLQKKLHYSIQE